MKYLCALLSLVAYAAASVSLVEVANNNNGSTLVSLLNTANLQGVLTDPSQGSVQFKYLMTQSILFNFTLDYKNLYEIT